MEDFERRGRGRGLGSPPFTENPPRGPITPEEGRPGGLSVSRCTGQSRTTLLSPQCPLLPLEDHPLMMLHRRPGNPQPQPQSQQPQENHHTPRYTPYDIGGHHYNDLYPPGQTIFCFWCGHPNPIPKYYSPLLISLEALLIQSQETLI